MLIVPKDKGYGKMPPVLEQLGKQPSPPAQIDL
jgi:hypothetical protein